MIVELIIRVYVFDESHEHAYELEYALNIGVEVLWYSKISEGKSCIWIWTCIFKYDDWSPWLMNTMRLGLIDQIYLMINALLMFLPSDILIALGYICARWMVVFYTKDESGTYAMFGC